MSYIPIFARQRNVYAGLTCCEWAFTKNECSFSGGDTQTLLVVKIYFNFMHPRAVGMQKLWALTFAPITSHLVKLSLPNILYASPHVIVFVSSPEQTRKRAFALVSQAYSSITGDDFAAFVGMPVNEAVDGMTI